MKANAPEKIWINPTIDLPKLNGVIGKDSVQYIQADAFIEKACELLMKMVWDVTYEDLEGNSTQHYDKMEFIEDFKNYMKKRVRYV